VAVINRARNFIFCHIYKTAGNSLRKIFSGEELMGYHVEMAEVQDWYRQKGQLDYYNQAFKFSFVRNPTTWMVSLYEYIRGSKPHGYHEEIKRKSYREFLVWYRDVAMKLDRPFGANKYLTLTDFLCDGDGNLLVDFVGHVERIQADVNQVCSRVGLKPRTVPNLNVGARRRKPNNMYYGEAERQLMREIFAEDYRRFNYPLP